MAYLSYSKKIISETDLTVSGGATPNVSSAELDLTHAVGPVSLFLYAETSTDISVTYQVGYVKDSAPTTTVWLTPADGGAVNNLTNKSVAVTTAYHGTVSLPAGSKYRFRIINNAAGAVADNCELYMFVTEEV